MTSLVLYRLNTRERSRDDVSVPSEARDRHERALLFSRPTHSMSYPLAVGQYTKNNLIVPLRFH